MHTFLNYFPICHHLFDVPQYVFDLAYVIYSKLYFDYIENAKLYWLTCQKKVKFRFVTTTGVSALEVKQCYCYLLETWSAA